MKILIQMGDSYPDESPCAKRMRTFHDVFVANGNEVIILAPRTTNSLIENEDTIYCPTVPLKKKNTLYRFLNSYIFAVSSFFMAKKINNIDVVITTAPPPLINKWGLRIAKIHKAILVYDVRDIWPDVAWEMGSFSKDSIYSRVFEHIRNSMLKEADMTIAVSPGKVKKLQSYNKKATIVEITNGLDEDFLNNAIDQVIIQKYGLDKQFSVCYIGNLGLAQGLIQLLNIALRAQELELPVKFYLFGSGVEEKRLKKYVDIHQINNVVFSGRIPNKTMFTVLKSCKMSFVSLVNENLLDSVPTKMYEAIGAGCPVLLAACGDSVKVLQNSGLGIAVKPNDIEEIWGAFLEMYQHIDIYEEKREQALKYILDNYSRQKAATEFERILEKMVEK